MNIDFAIEIFNIGTPLYKSIRLIDIISFYNLYSNPNSNFHKWYSKNFELIKKINRIMEPILDDYYESNIDENLTIIKSLAKLTLSTPSTKSYNETIYNPGILEVNAGGVRIEREDLITIQSGILYYLFRYDSINVISLPKPKSYFNADDIKYITDLTGDRKNKSRLIYIIGINNDEFVCKITTNEPFYFAEANIYKELNALKYPWLDNKIVEIYGSDTLDVTNYDMEMNFSKKKLNIISC